MYRYCKNSRLSKKYTSIYRYYAMYNKLRFNGLSLIYRIRKVIFSQHATTRLLMYMTSYFTCSASAGQQVLRVVVDN